MVLYSLLVPIQISYLEVSACDGSPFINNIIELFVILSLILL